MAMCEHMRARKLRLREFPARYAFRPLPCDDCGYVMQLPDLYMCVPCFVFMAFACFLIFLYVALTALLDVDPGQWLGIAVAAFILQTYLYMKIVGYRMYSMTWDMLIRDE